MSSAYALLEMRTTELDDDGNEVTVTLDLFTGDDGFLFRSWKMKRAQYKDGGVFQDSPYVDGRKMVFRRFENVIETIKLSQQSDNTNAAGIAEQELTRWLERAADYRPYNSQTYPTYLAVVPRGQTEEQYALIVSGTVPEYTDPFNSPFFDVVARELKNTWEEINLIIERGHWTENPPTQGTAVPTYAIQTFNGRTYGTVDNSRATEPVTSPDVFTGNKHVYSNLTNIHIGTGGGNRIGAALPFNIFTAGSYTYFGVDTSVSGATPFGSIIFDIGTIAAGTTLALDAEYYNGSTWTDLTIRDTTHRFLDTGIRGIFFTPPSAWATTTPGGSLPTGWWIRIRFTGTLTTSPQQQNRDIYTVSWPYTNVDKENVGGSIDALMKLVLQNGSLAKTGSPTVSMDVNWAMVATRSLERGADFTPYLNTTIEADDLPPGVELTIFDPGYNDPTDPRSPTGRAVEYFASAMGAGAVAPTPRFGIKLQAVSSSDNVARQWGGRYRLFLRYIQVGGSVGDFLVQIKLNDISLASGGLGTTYYTTEENPTTIADALAVIDCGSISIKNDVHGVYIAVWLGKPATGATTQTIRFTDIILMPVDEYSAIIDGRDSTDTLYGSTTIGTEAEDDDKTKLVLDGIRGRTAVIYSVTEGITDNPLTIKTGHHRLKNNRDQRIWTFQRHDDYAGVAVVSRSNVERNQQYLGFKGAG